MSPRTLSRRPAAARRRGAHRRRVARAARREEARARAEGGPVDRALYTCACGNAWQADVTATVTCPGCGAPQPW